MKSLSHRLSLDKVRDKIRSLSSRHFCVMEKQKPASGRELPLSMSEYIMNLRRIVGHHSLLQVGASVIVLQMLR